MPHVTRIIAVDNWPSYDEIDEIVAFVAPMLSQLWLDEGFTVWDSPLHVMFFRPGEIGPNANRREQMRADAVDLVAGTDKVALAVTLTDDPLMEYVVGVLEVDVEERVIEPDSD